MSPVFFHRRFAPSPLAGEGWGEGAFPLARYSGLLPCPRPLTPGPSPARAEGGILPPSPERT